MGKQYDITFQMDARLGSGYSGAFRNAQAAISQYRKEYAQASTEIRDISGFQKQQQAAENTRGRLEILQQQYANIQREMDETGNHSSELANKLLDKKAQIDKVTQAYQVQTERLNAYRQKLQDAGVDTSKLDEETERLKKELDDLKKKFEESGDGAGNFGEDLSNLESALAALGLTKLLKEAYELFKECTDAAMEFEYAMAGVRRTVGGTDEFLTDLGDSFKEMSTDIPITTTELGDIAETAGQLGVAQEYVEEFTVVMAELGTTTDLSADSAATMLAQFANITGITDYERLGSVVASLGDSTATTASKVVEMSLGMAASASIAGFSERDILALAAAVGSLGIESQAGSTAMSQLISTLYKATETGEKLEEIAAISGMSAAEFKKAWGEDAVGTMNTFIRGLTNVERNGRSAIVLLDELGISNVRQVKAILSLAQAGDLLSGTIEQANTAWEQNTALGEKAAVMYGTTQAKLTMMQNAWNNVKIAVGDQFTPALSEVYGLLTSIFSGISKFVQDYPVVAKVIIALTAGVAAFVVGLTGYIVVAKLAKRATEALTTAMNANPYLLLGSVIAGIVVSLATLAVTASAAQEEEEQLTATTVEQQRHLESLRQEYENVCEAEGKTSASATLLKKQIDEETAAFENSKETMEEYLERRQEVLDASREQREEHQNEELGLAEEFDTTTNLISRLQELTEAEYQSAEAKREIAAIVDILNESIPELGLNYDEMTGQLNITPETLLAIAERQYLLDLATERQGNLQETIRKVHDLEAKADTDQEQLEAAQRNREYYLGKDGYITSDAWTLGDQWEYDQEYSRTHGGTYRNKETGERISTNDWWSQANAANNAFVDAKGRVEETNTSLATAIAERDELLGLLTGTDADSATGGDPVKDMISQYQDQIEALTESYNAAYEAAYSSISGQFDLWETAPEIVEKSVGDMIAAMQSQTAYWSSYSSSLDTILSYTGQIEGLGDVVADLGTGSEDAVAYSAAIAQALQSGDIALVEQLVTEYQNLKMAQEEASGKFADVETGYTDKVLEMAQEIATGIEELDIDQTAYDLGELAIEQFVSGAEGKLTIVQEAYRMIGEAAANALYGAFDLSKASTSGGYNPTNGRMQAYASGTRNARRGYALVGEDGPEIIYFNGGEAVLSAEESKYAMQVSNGLAEWHMLAADAQIIGVIPQLMESMSARSVDAIAAESVAPGCGVVLHFAPSYSITGASSPDEIREILAAHDAEMKEQIRELLAEEQEDAQRRAYV